MRENYWKVTQSGKAPKLNKPIFIEGLPGIGNVGKIAVDFLIDELKAKKLFEITSYTFPHSVFVNEDNLVELPVVEIFYRQFKNKSDVLLLGGDVQPIDEVSSYEFSDKILDLAQKQNVREIITLGGIGLSEIPKKPKVYCTGNSKKIVDAYKNDLVSNNLYGVVGPIVGVSGLLLGLASKRNINAVSLLAETYGHPMYLGIKGAKELLRVLESKFNYGIDLKKMSKEIIQVENELLKKTKEWLSEHVSSQAGATAKKQDTNYIG